MYNRHVACFLLRKAPSKKKNGVKRSAGNDGKSEKRGTSFLSSPFPSSPALLVSSLSPVPYLSPLERERGLCGGESVACEIMINYL